MERKKNMEKLNEQNVGLYNKSFEHDNCGIGAIVNIKGIKSHKTVENALSIVENLEHRAGKDAEGITGKGIQMDDGLFEVALVREPKNPLEFQQVVAGMFSKSQDSPMVDRFKTSKIVFESEEAISWTVDGEYADVHQRVEIEVVAKAINIIKGE